VNDSTQNETVNKKATDTARKSEDTPQNVQGHGNNENEELDCLKPGPNKVSLKYAPYTASLTCILICHLTIF
jgi:hypothetical protein